MMEDQLPDNPYFYINQTFASSCPLATMDPSIFLPYSPPQGLPQESKLATYMNRGTSTPTRSLAHSLSKISLDSSPTSVKKVLVGEFVPLNYYSPANILPESPDSSPPSALSLPSSSTQVHQENVGGTTYFYSTNSDSLNASAAHNSAVSLVGPEALLVSGVGPMAIASPYASQMYACPPTHMPPMNSKSGLAPTFYLPETIRSEIYQRNDDIYLQTDVRLYPDLPENVEMYTELTPVEIHSPHSMATSFRATHRRTGEYFALRRLHAYNGPPTNRMEMWKMIDHPNVVRLHEYFTTNAFGDLSMVLVYDYHAASITVLGKYLGGGTAPDGGGFHDPFSSDPDAPRPYTHQKNAMLRAVACGVLLPEAVLWSMLVQLTAALRVIHGAGLACRALDMSKVIMNGGRVRIAWCGVLDLLHTNTNDLVQAQQEDLMALGRLALSMACRTMHCDNLPASIDLISRTYSTDLKNLILYLLAAAPSRRTVIDLMPMIGARFYTQVEAMERRADEFEGQLAREIDNGRLLRILIKLGTVNERPELNMDASWSETGDRYMLKLFRDYLFHSVTPDGRPWIDMGHVTTCLNQLDAGTATTVALMSRDEQSVLVVTYTELKHCLEAAYDEVMQAATPCI